MSLFAGLNLGELDGSATEELTNAGGGRFMDIGLFEDVAIKTAAIGDTKDDNWKQVAIEFSKEGFRTKKYFLYFPINNEGLKTYNGKDSGVKFILFKIKAFFQAIGFADEKVASTADVLALMPKVFDAVEKLVGLKVCIDCGYNKTAHPIYIEKGVYHLELSNGKLCMKEDGAPLTFDNSKAAVEYAKNELDEKKASSFSEILSITPPTTPNDLKRFGMNKNSRETSIDLL